MAASDTDELTGDWDPADPETQADYPAAQERVRREAPVAWCGRWGGFYTLMRYDDVVAASRDPETFTATRMTVIPSSPRKGLPRLPLQKDPPESNRFRKGLNPFFKENRIRTLEPEMIALADRLMADLKASPAEADFARGFAEPFTQGTLGLLLGLDGSETSEIGRLSHDYVEAVQGEDLETAGRLSREVDGFAIRLVEDRLARPRNLETDIVSGLAASEPEGAPYTGEELAGMVRLMLIGGHIVPRNFLCSVAWHMATHPDHVDLLRQDRTAWKPFIEELLRFYPANQALVRVATQDTSISGVSIPEGCPVALNFLSANRDEDVFENAMEFLPKRSPNRHIAFGIGPHMCLGVAVAKAQVRIVLDALLTCDGLAVVGEPRRAKWTEYGISSITLDLRARQ